MGFIKEVLLYCDGESDNCICPGEEANSADGDFRDIASYKRDAKKDGWVFRKGNRAYCPNCAKALLKGR